MSSKTMLNFIIKCAFWGLCGILLFLLFKWGLPLIMPFGVGFLAAFCVHPIINRLQIHSSRQGARLSLLLLIVLYGLVLAAFILIILKGILLIQNFFIGFPDFYRQTLAPSLVVLQDFFKNLSARFFPAQSLFVDSLWNGILHSFQSAVQQISISFVTALAHFVAGFPVFLVNCGVAVLCSFFIAWDYDKIRGFILGHLSQRQKDFLFDIREQVFLSLGKAAKAALILCSVTFGELCLGLSLLQVAHPFQNALIIALVDILPVFGCGTIMIPWGILQLLSRNYPLGAGILILYAIITFIRQTIEPKILGKQLGLHPLVILFFMYLGSKLFGLLGLLFAPLAATIVLQLWRLGKKPHHQASAPLSNGCKQENQNQKTD